MIASPHLTSPTGRDEAKVDCRLLSLCRLFAGGAGLDSVQPNTHDLSTIVALELSTGPVLMITSPNRISLPFSAPRELRCR
jgi:hypothetical protein